MEWISLALSIIGFVTLIIKEFLSAKAQADEEKRKFDLNEAAFRDIVGKALNKHVKTMAKDSAGAGGAWDTVQPPPKPKLSEVPKDGPKVS